MRTIHLTQRQARVLRENLTLNQQGYDFLDLRRLDHLATKLVELQGEYGQRMAELVREEKQARRQIAKGVDADKAQSLLVDIAYECDDLHEAADLVPVCFTVEDGDYKLIKDKLDGQTNWLANDDIRHVIIGMLDAVENAEKGEIEDSPKPAEVKQFRRK